MSSCLVQPCLRYSEQAAVGIVATLSPKPRDGGCIERPYTIEMEK